MTKRLAIAALDFEGNRIEQQVLIDRDDELPAWNGQDLRLVGRSATRIDAPYRVTGRARYTVDIVLPRMLHAAVLRSPVANGRVTALELDAARKLPGVRAVLGPEDSVGVLPSPLTATPQYAGAPIAAVAADSDEVAHNALRALALKVKELPFTIDPQDAVHDMRFSRDPKEYLRGDPNAFAGSEVRVELELDTPYQVHTPLEPHAALADWQPDKVTVWLSSQGMFNAREAIATRFGLPKSSVRVIAEFVGGGFGSKTQASEEAVLAVALSQRTGRPVKLVYSRHEEQLVGGHRGAMRHAVRLGARHDGTLTALEFDSIVTMGMAEEHQLLPVVGAPFTMLYRCENVQTAVFPVKVNVRPIVPFRGGGVTEGTTILEQAIDELAVKLDCDPLELRKRIYADADPLTEKPYSGKALLRCYERAAELSGWAERGRLRLPRGDGLLRGMGCASQFWWGRGAPPAQCTIRVGSDGIANVVTGIQEVGSGTLTSARIVAAEALGLPLARVRVLGGDTGAEVVGPAAGGSVTTGTVMPAVRVAATRVRRALLDVAGDLFEASPDDLVLEEGRIRSVDGALDRDYTDVTARFGNSTIEETGARGLNDERFAVQTWGCQVAQVAVDPGVGTVRVEKVWAVHDVGRIINPLLATSQAHGGILQAIGFALTEERVLDPTTGAPTNAHLDEYKLPTIADCPEIVVEFIDEPDPIASSTGAKGLGEPPVIPTAAAIANAFAHATGRRCQALPMTPARVLEALA